MTNHFNILRCALICLFQSEWVHSHSLIFEICLFATSFIACLILLLLLSLSQELLSLTYNISRLRSQQCIGRLLRSSCFSPFTKISVIPVTNPFCRVLSKSSILSSSVFTKSVKLSASLHSSFKIYLN